MITDEFGNRLFESEAERFLTSRNLRPPFWIPFECYRIENEMVVLVMPLNVWVPKAGITKQEGNKLFLNSRYIGTLLDCSGRPRGNGKQTAWVILEHLNQEYKKGGLAPQNTALP